MIDRRRIEICRALISRPRLLLLDEPSAGMTLEETQRLMGDLLLVKRRMPGLTIILIEHEMSVIERITGRCVVLNYGRKIAEGTYAEVARDRKCASVPGAGVTMSEGLRVEGLYTAYDRADVLEDVSVVVDRAASLPARVERLRQDHADPRNPRPDAASPWPVLFGDRDLTRLPTHAIVALGIRPSPRGARSSPAVPCWRTCCSGLIWSAMPPSSGSGWSASSRCFPVSPSGESSSPAPCPAANRR